MTGVSHSVVIKKCINTNNNGHFLLSFIYIYLYFCTFIKYNIMVIYRVDYEQKKRIIQK